MAVVMVTGGQGKLGSELLPLLKNIFPDGVLAPSIEQIDIRDKNQVLAFAKSNKPDVILHLAAVADQKWAETHKPESYMTNVLGTRNVSEVAHEIDAKVIYISTDYVFDGLAGNYSETDEPKPANWYGFTKYAGELEVKHSGARHCIIRTSFRPKVWPFPTAFTNVITSADYIDVISSEIALCIKKDYMGVIHIGTAKKSFYELAMRRNPSVRPEINTDNAFPKNRFLNIDKWLLLRQQ